MLEENKGVYDVKVVRGSQVVLNPSLAKAFAEVVGEVGWELNAILWECFHLNECVAFAGINGNVRMVGYAGEAGEKGARNPSGLSIREYIKGSSLVNLAAMLVPEGEAKVNLQRPVSFATVIDSSVCLERRLLTVPCKLLLVFRTTFWNTWMQFATACCSWRSAWQRRWKNQISLDEKRQGRHSQVGVR